MIPGSIPPSGGGGTSGSGTTGTSSILQRYNDAIAAAKAEFNSALDAANIVAGRRDEVRVAELAAQKQAADQRLADALAALGAIGQPNPTGNNNGQPSSSPTWSEQQESAYQAAVAQISAGEQAALAAARAKRDLLVAKAEQDKQQAFDQAGATLAAASQQIGAAYDAAISGAIAAYDAAAQAAQQAFDAAAGAALSTANSALGTALSAYNTAVTNAANARRAALAGLSQNYDGSVVDDDPVYQAAIAAEAASYQTMIDGILNGFASQIQTLRSTYGTAIGNADSTFTAAVAQADSQYDSATQTAFSTHQSSVAGAASVFDAAVANLNNSFDGKVATAITTFNTETDEADSKYNTEIARIQAKYVADVAKAQADKTQFYSTKPQEYVDKVKEQGKAWGEKVVAAYKKMIEDPAGLVSTELDAVIGALTGLKDLDSSSLDQLRSTAIAAILQAASSAKETYLDTISAPLTSNSDDAFEIRQNHAVQTYVSTVYAAAIPQIQSLKSAIMEKLNTLKGQVNGAVSATGSAELAYTNAINALQIAFFNADEGGHAAFLGSVAGLQSELLAAVHEAEAKYSKAMATAERERDDATASATKDRSIEKSTAGKKLTDAIAEAEKSYVTDYSSEWKTLQGKITDARDQLNSDLASAETAWVSAFNAADDTWVNSATSAATSYVAGIGAARSSAVASVGSALSGHVSSTYSIWSAAMQRAYPDATDISAFTSAWQSYSQTVASSWASMANSVYEAINSYDTTLTEASNTQLKAVAQQGHTAASAMVRAEADRLIEAAQALRQYDTSVTQAAVQAAKEIINAETQKDKEDATAQKESNDAMANKYDEEMKKYDAKIEEELKKITDAKKDAGTEFISKSYAVAEEIQSQSAANTATEAQRLTDIMKAEAEAVRDRVVAATKLFLDRKIAGFEKNFSTSLENIQKYYATLMGDITPDVQQALDDLQMVAGNGWIPTFLRNFLNNKVEDAKDFIDEVREGAQGLFDGATQMRALDPHPSQDGGILSGNLRMAIPAAQVYKSLLGLSVGLQPIYSKSGQLVGMWDVAQGIVTRNGTSGSPSIVKRTLSYDNVIAKDNADGATMTAEDWNVFFGLDASNNTPDPGTETVTYKIFEFLVGRERLIQPGGTGSDILIAAQLVTEVGGMVDPTGVCDGLNAAVLVAGGQYGEAALAVASIAVPFGAEKLMKSGARVAGNVVESGQEVLQATAGAVMTKLDGVLTKSGREIADAGIGKAARACPDGSCFVAGTSVLVREASLDFANSESDFDSLVALGAFGAMIILTIKPEFDDSESHRGRRKRRMKNQQAY